MAGPWNRSWIIPAAFFPTEKLIKITKFYWHPVVDDCFVPISTDISTAHDI
jgi:hypothetical protein